MRGRSLWAHESSTSGGQGRKFPFVNSVRKSAIALQFILGRQLPPPLLEQISNVVFTQQPMAVCNQGDRCVAYG